MRMNYQTYRLLLGKLMIRNFFSMAVKSKKEERDNGYFQKYRDIIYAKNLNFLFLKVVNYLFALRNLRN